MRGWRGSEVSRLSRDATSALGGVRTGPGKFYSPPFCGGRRAVAEGLESCLSKRASAWLLRGWRGSEVSRLSRDATSALGGVRTGPGKFYSPPFCGGRRAVAEGLESCLSKRASAWLLRGWRGSDASRLSRDATSALSELENSSTSGGKEGRRASSDASCMASSNRFTAFSSMC